MYPFLYGRVNVQTSWPEQYLWKTANTTTEQGQFYYFQRRLISQLTAISIPSQAAVVVSAEKWGFRTTFGPTRKSGQGGQGFSTPPPLTMDTKLSRRFRINIVYNCRVEFAKFLLSRYFLGELGLIR